MPGPDIPIPKAPTNQAGEMVIAPTNPTHCESALLTGLPELKAEVSDDDAPVLELGRMLGGYRLEKQLGSGGMGAVFLAEDIKLMRKVALKVMKPESAVKKVSRERFLREARAAARIEHLHVIPILQIGEEDGIPFIAMPFLKGEPLDARLKRGRLAVPEILTIGRQTAEALAAAHKHGMIHRDIKPANIWLETPPGGSGINVKILDFGLARLTGDEEQLTRAGAILGTPAYMSPEQARALDVDHRADLFSLGVVLYEMATGKQPFKGRDAMAILTSLALDTPPAPIELNPELPPLLSNLIIRLLEKDPDDRIGWADDAADVLKRLQPESTIVLISQPKTIEEAGPKTIINTFSMNNAAEPGAEQPVSSKPVAPQPIFSRPIVPQPVRNLPVAPQPASNKPMIPQRVYSRPVAPQPVSPGEVGKAPRGGESERDDGSGWNRDRKRRLPSGVFAAVCLIGALVALIVFGRKDPPFKPPTQESQAKSVTDSGKPKPRDKPKPPPADFVNSIGMEFAWVPSGESWLGGGKNVVGDKKAVIPNGFYLGMYEVTQEEWDKVMRDDPDPKNGDPSYFKANVAPDVTKEDLKRFPVENVSWDVCQKFITRLNEQTKETGWEYRLPREVEWEYACRGGPMAVKSERTERAFDYYLETPSNSLLPDQANFAHGGHLRRTNQVGSYPPNRLGLFDMHGNVSEWCADEIPNPKSKKDAPLRFSRGGSWIRDAGDCRAVDRDAPTQLSGLSTVGLRVARVPAGAKGK